jgi:PTS system cellobiose-specific IIA component
MLDYEQIVMHLVVNGGEARTSALKAVAAAREGDIEKAGALMKSAGESLSEAHKIQTDLIQKEAGGEKTEISLLMVHAQDHLMNAMTVMDLAQELIKSSKILFDLQSRL